MVTNNRMGSNLERKIAIANDFKTSSSSCAASWENLSRSRIDWWNWNHQISSARNVGRSSASSTSDSNQKISTKFSHSHVVSHLHVGRYLSSVNIEVKLSTEEKKIFFSHSEMSIHRFGMKPMWSCSKFNVFERIFLFLVVSQSILLAVYFISDKKNERKKKKK